MQYIRARTRNTHKRTRKHTRTEPRALSLYHLFAEASESEAKQKGEGAAGSAKEDVDQQVWPEKEKTFAEKTAAASERAEDKLAEGQVAAQKKAQEAADAACTLEEVQVCV